MTQKQIHFYWRLWAQACSANGWTRADKDRRHALHVEALGFDCSHLDFENEHFDRVIHVMRLAAEPDNLDAVIRSQHPEMGERTRLLYRIRQLAPEPYIRKIAEAMFKSPHYDLDLDIVQLTALRNILVQRARAHAKARAAASESTTQSEAAMSVLA